MKTEDLYLEYARVIKMCEGTNVQPWDCVEHQGRRADFEKHPRFDGRTCYYRFAVAIIEDTPMFVGDELYYTGIDNKKYTITENGYKHNNIDITYSWTNNTDVRWTLKPPTFSVKKYQLKIQGETTLNHFFDDENQRNKLETIINNVIGLLR